MEHSAAFQLPLSDAAVRIDAVCFDYGPRRALDSISFEVAPGELFGLLGPNGGGKTTLFRILSTLVQPQGGRLHVFGHDVRDEQALVRSRMGVVFQHPSIDGKLTVRENLRHHGRLYGLSRREINERTDEALSRLGLADRATDYVETLSGGQQRRVELAKGLITRPSLFVLDEPSTGLDPGARRELWRYLRGLREERGTTILVTTHLMEEAEGCDRLAILDHGKIVTLGTPNELRHRIGGDVITVHTDDPQALAQKVAQQLGGQPIIFDDSFRIEKSQGHLMVRQLIESFGEEITGVNLSKPTLEDVFVHETGHRFWDEE